MHEKINLTLFQGVLNDDNITILEDGYCYQGHNRANVKLTYYTYANEWSNHDHHKFFKSLDNACAWYKKHMLDRAIYQGACWLSDDDEALAELVNNHDFDYVMNHLTKEQKADALNEWEALTVYCEF